MAKIDLEKLICSLAEKNIFLRDALKEQGLEYKDGEIVEVQKPKFKVGDWISGYYTNYKVLSVNNEGYVVEDTDGNKINILFENEKLHHLFTTADAKNGDVLVVPHIEGSEHSEQIFIFKEIKDREYTKNAVEYYCRYLDGEFRTNERGFMGQADDYFTPATKEQRELLFQKMKEAGYEWDADKKELKKIRKPLYGRGDIIEYRGCPYFIEEVVTPKENIFYYNVVSLCFGEKSRRISIGAESEKDIILISNNRFDYEQANIQQKDFAPKASTANRQVYNRAILAVLSTYVEKYPDTRFGQMLCNLDIKPHFDEESREAYWNLCKIINKRK